MVQWVSTDLGFLRSLAAASDLRGFLRLTLRGFSRSQFVTLENLEVTNCDFKFNKRSIAMTKIKKISTILPERIERRIYSIRGQKVLLSHDLAQLYEVEPRILV